MLIPSTSYGSASMSYLKRFARVIFGLAVFSFGSYLNIQANIGLAPWEAFGVGVSKVLPISYGDVILYSGLIILVIDFLLKEKLGLGTVLDVLLVGKLVDLYSSLNIVPMQTSFVPGLFMLLLGQFLLCVGSVFYIGAGLGCGPRDALMVALGKRLNKFPIGLVRALIEGCVLLTGWLLGAKIGAGTIIAVFGIGFMLQFTFRLFRFDVKGVKHESILTTFMNIFGGRGAKYENTRG